MVNVPSANSSPVSRDMAPQSTECPPDSNLPENTKENLDAKLDHAIEETFPTSDPVSVSITKGGAIDYDREENASPSAAEGAQQPEQNTAENLLDVVRETLGNVSETVPAGAREAYDQGKRFVRQVRDRYPQAEQYYRAGGRAVEQRVTESPWLALLVAGALGYGLAWLVHGGRSHRAERVPDYARTRRGYAPYRSERRG
jgi:ElaB/YqjD/DUF883 family membrane-anchored ribosome-binding protein